MYSRAALKMGLTVIVAIFALAALAMLALPRAGLARAQTPTPTPQAETPGFTRTVSVAGHGEMRAAPDQATVTIGVESQAPTAEAALDDNNTRMTALLRVIRNAGVASKDIQTSGFNIFPVYREQRVETEPPQVTAYQVRNQVVVTVRQLDGLGPLLDAVVRAGANQIHGIAFGFSDPQGLLDQARERAMNDAHRKAAQLATLGDSELGPVLTISEGGAQPPPIVVERVAAMAEAAATVPVEVGEGAVTVDVQVTYALR